jgi:hypothetical protein
MKTAPGSNSTRRNLLIATLALTGIAAVTAAVLIGAGDRAAVPYNCEQSTRVVVLDLSSQNRSDETVQGAADVITAQTLASAICDEPLAVVGVAGGRQVLIDPAPHLRDELKGPNARARANVVSRESAEVRSLVVRMLQRTYSDYPDVDATSVPALFDAAAALVPGEGSSRVVLLTTGVHVDPTLSLNRPLARDEGTRLADELDWPHLGKRVSVTIIGVTRMDGDVPVPGDQWPREVTAFNRSACRSTGAGACELYQVAAVEKALI